MTTKRKCLIGAMIAAIVVVIAGAVTWGTRWYVRVTSEFVLIGWQTKLGDCMNAYHFDGNTKKVRAVIATSKRRKGRAELSEWIDRYPAILSAKSVKEATGAASAF